MAIEVKNLSKAFGSFQAVQNVSFKIKPGSLVALLGPSGSGKSTILRMIAGLEKADKGEILLTGEQATHVPVEARQVGFVFQHYALFRHMDIWQNIAFGLEVQKKSKEQIKSRVSELLHLVQLKGFEKHYPHQLSGGQRQRVALARALATRPRVLLLDEPFGALDAKVREELRHWIRHLHKETGMTSLFVTHDQSEALEIADEIIVLNKGRIEQVGSPQELYENPQTSFVASFLGPANLLKGNITKGRAQIGQFQFEVGTSHTDPDIQVEALIRPSDIVVDGESVDGLPGAKVSKISYLGWGMKVYLVLSDGQNLTVHLTMERFRELKLEEGQEVFIKPTDARVFTKGKIQDFSI